MRSLTDVEGRADGLQSPVATVSVVVPAHDEARTLKATLAALQVAAVQEVMEIIVVANGCSDDTADVARACGAVVVEIEEASKIAALRAGDSVATTFPRVYLDADIRLSPGAMDSLAHALRRDAPVVASPSVVFDTAGCSWSVRAFYRAYERIPYIRHGLIGLGIYGMSQAGRARFDEFPDVKGDDLFVQRLFDTSERITSTGEFIVSAPRDLGNLLKVRTRVAAGNAELAEPQSPVEIRGEVARDGHTRYERSTGSTGRSLATAALRSPTVLPDIAVYVAVTVAARVLARRRGTSAWHRDTSTR